MRQGQRLDKIVASHMVVGNDWRLLKHPLDIGDGMTCLFPGRVGLEFIPFHFQIFSQTLRAMG